MEEESSSSACSLSSDSDYSTDSEFESVTAKFISCIKSRNNKNKVTEPSKSTKRPTVSNINSDSKDSSSSSSKADSLSPVTENDPDCLPMFIDKRPGPPACTEEVDGEDIAVFNLSDMNFDNSVSAGTAEETMQLLNSDSSDGEVVLNFKTKDTQCQSDDEETESLTGNSVDSQGNLSNNDLLLVNIRKSQTESDTESEEDEDPVRQHKSDTKDKDAVQNNKRKQKKKRYGQLSSSLQTEESVKPYVTTDYKMAKLKTRSLEQRREPEVMKKSVIPDDIESMTTISTTQESLRKLKKQRKLEREKTKGKRWFDMPAPEMTDELKRDLEVLQMRKALNPKRFYKKNDRAGLPKYFQFGRIVETAADFYHSRVPKKQRKTSIVEELLADAEFRTYNKRKYAEIVEARRQGHGPYSKFKRLKKPKKK